MTATTSATATSASTSDGADVRPLTGALGAEVHGVDLARSTPSSWDTLYATWLEHLVLFFPGQSLDADAHVALGRRFGEPEIHPVHPQARRRPSRDRRARHRRRRRRVLAHRRHLQRHAADGVDPADDRQPAPWRRHALHQPVPRLRTLSDPMRDLARRSSTAVHTASAFGHPEQSVDAPGRAHTSRHRAQVALREPHVHVAPRGAATLRERRAARATSTHGRSSPHFQCRYRWDEGTIGIWDNRCTQHYAVPDYDERRVIERVTVIGDTPFGGTARWEPFTKRRATTRATPTTTRAR